MKVQVLYVSKTGNTEELAKSIYHAVPIPSKDIKQMDSCCESKDAETYFIGFWTNRGTGSLEILDYLSELHGKNIALFGTCGMGCDTAYYQKIIHNIEAFIPDDNHYFGTFLCQGKMSIHIRRKYEQMDNPANHEQIQKMIQNFDEGLLHPNGEDLKSAEQFTKDVFEKIERLRKQENKK